MAELPAATRDEFTVRLLIQGLRRNTTRAYLLDNMPPTFARAKVVAVKFEELLQKGIVDISKYPPDEGKYDVFVMALSSAAPVYLARISLLW